MQRRKVVLPEPLGPMMTTASPRATSIETPRSTSSRPKRLWTSTARNMGSAIAPIFYAPPARASNTTPATHERQRPREQRLRPLPLGDGEGTLELRLEKAEDGDEHEIPEGRHRVQLHHLEALRSLYLRRVTQLHDADGERHRGVLEHGYQLVARGRHDHPQRLRQDHSPHRWQVGHPQRLRGVHLARFHGEDPAAHDLRHVRRLVEAESDNRRPPARPVVAEQVVLDQLSEADVNDQKLQDHRRRPPQPY